MTEGPHFITIELTDEQLLSLVKLDKNMRKNCAVREIYDPETGAGFEVDYEYTDSLETEIGTVSLEIDGAHDSLCRLLINEYLQREG